MLPTRPAALRRLTSPACFMRQKSIQRSPFTLMNTAGMKLKSAVQKAISWTVRSLPKPLMMASQHE
jgi:hypothetical protein